MMADFFHNQDELKFYTTPELAAQTLLEKLVETARDERYKAFHIALSGGSTPKCLFDEWAKGYAARTPWKKMHFYFVDERCVPPDSDESNYKLAKESLFEKVDLDPSQIFRIKGENEPEDETMRYEIDVLDNLPIVDAFPRFDYILLGVGEDGHTSSIFPGMYDLLDTTDVYATSVNPHNGSQRIGMTAPTLCNADNTCFFVSGTNKRDIVLEMLKEENIDRLPASYVWHRARNPELYAAV